MIIPAFAVDQDHGWDTDYYVPRNRDFIKSQRQEVIRFLMGVQPRHPLRTKTDFEDAKSGGEGGPQRGVAEVRRRPPPG